MHAGDLGGGPVGQEVEEREGADDQRARDGQRGQLLGAEVPDHRGVDEQVERLGGQRAEGGQGEREDLSVVRRAQPRHEAASVEHEVVAVHGLLGRTWKQLAHRVGLQALDPVQLARGVGDDALAHRASVADDLHGVAGLELALDVHYPDGQEARAALAQRTLGALVYGETPVVGFAYLSQSLKLETRPRCGWKPVPVGSPESAAAIASRSVPLVITTGMPAAVAISAATTFERIPPEPSGELATPMS